jgi:hypothetical protein
MANYDERMKTIERTSAALEAAEPITKEIFMGVHNFITAELNSPIEGRKFISEERVWLIYLRKLRLQASILWDEVKKKLDLGFIQQRENEMNTQNDLIMKSIMEFNVKNSLYNIPDLDYKEVDLGTIFVAEPWNTLFKEEERACENYTSEGPTKLATDYSVAIESIEKLVERYEIVYNDYLAGKLINQENYRVATVHFFEKFKRYVKVTLASLDLVVALRQKNVGPVKKEVLRLQQRVHDLLHNISKIAEKPRKRPAEDAEDDTKVMKGDETVADDDPESDVDMEATGVDEDVDMEATGPDDNIISALQETKSKLEATTETLTKLAEKTNKAEARALEAEKESLKYKAELEKSQIQFKQLSEEYNNVNAAFKQVDEALRTAAATNGSNVIQLQTRLQGIEAEKTRIETDMASVRQEGIQKDHKISALMQQAAQWQAEAQGIQLQYANIIGQCHKTQSDLKNDVNLLEAFIKQMLEGVSEKQVSDWSVEEAQKFLNDNLVKKKDIFKQLEQDRAAFDAQAKKVQDEADAKIKNTTNSLMQEANKQWQELLKKHEGELNELKKADQEYRSEKEREIVGLKHEITNLQKEILEAKAKYDQKAVEKMIEDARDKFNTAHETVIKKYEAQVRELEKKLEEAPKKEELVRLETQVHEEQASKKAAETEIQALKARLAAAPAPEIRNKKHRKHRYDSESSSSSSDEEDERRIPTTTKKEHHHHYHHQQQPIYIPVPMPPMIPMMRPPPQQRRMMMMGRQRMDPWPVNGVDGRAYYHG